MDRLILVQHCQSEHHVAELTGGWTDTALTELGCRQADRVAARLRAIVCEEPCQIVTSDLKRAVQTAEIIASVLDAEVHPLRALRELNNGEATGQTEQWARQHIDRTDWSLFDWSGFAGGETWRQFYRRVADCMDELAASADALPIIVTHGGTVSNIVTWWLRLPLDSLPERNPFATSPGGISLLKTNQYGNPVVACLNDTSHLAGLV